MQQEKKWERRKTEQECSEISETEEKIIKLYRQLPREKRAIMLLSAALSAAAGEVRVVGAEGFTEGEPQQART